MRVNFWFDYVSVGWRLKVVRPCCPFDSTCRPTTGGLPLEITRRNDCSQRVGGFEIWTTRCSIYDRRNIAGIGTDFIFQKKIDTKCVSCKYTIMLIVISETWRYLIEFQLPT